MKKKKNQLQATAPVSKGKRALENGVPTLKDLMAPPAFDRSAPDHIRVGNKFARSMLIAGYPKRIRVGWADEIYDYDGDLDVAIHISPTEERNALDQLTSKITQFQAQLETEIEKGSNRNITRLQNQIRELVEEREKVEQSYISLFAIQMVMNLYTDTLEQMNKETQLLENSLKGKKIKLMPNYLRQDQGYKSALPYGKSWLPKNFRNFSSEGLTACFPFYNSEISHPGGVLMGVNLTTQTPIYVDFYNRKLLNSGNATVFGGTGSGKTFLVSLLTMRSALKKIRTAIVDPEGDYTAITEALGGSVIEIAPGSASCINPFDIEDEDEVDEDDKPTGRKIVRIKDKVADLLNLIGVMCGSMTQEQRSLTSFVLNAVYADFGFTENPDSLYISEPTLNKAGEFIHHGQKRTMPTFSDFHNKLLEYSKMKGNESLVSVANTLRMFTKSGVYGLFDTQTTESLSNFKDSPVITFNVKQLEEDVLRPIGMYIALSWIWEKFAKKNLKVKKRIICDEAWMLLNKNMVGHEYTAKFLETTARRIRKRNGALLVASQNFREFSDSPQGRAVLTNSSVNIFLRQNETDIDEVQTMFKLSDGERGFLSTAKKGHFLLKMGQESTVGYAIPFDYEKYLIEKHTVAGVA